MNQQSNQPPNPKPVLKVWVTLLNSFTRFLSTDQLYNEHVEYKGEEAMESGAFAAQQFGDFIDSINRVPKVIPPAIEGSAYGEVMVSWANGEINPQPLQEFYKNGNPKGEPSFKCHYMNQDRQGNLISEHDYTWNWAVAAEIVEHFKGGVHEHFTSGLIQTKYGLIELYGYVDIIRMNMVSDLKKTGKYDAFKFIKEWQYRAYLELLRMEGLDVDTFRYLVCAGDRHVYHEDYTYTPEFRDQLVAHCEALYEFVENNRELVTNKKLLCIEEAAV